MALKPGELEEVSSSKCFGGVQKVFRHHSEEIGNIMKFGMFFPSSACNQNVKLPIVYFLSGLTSDEQQFIVKSGFQQYAEEYQLIVVNPDTSPRGCNIPGEDDSYDLGTGAGFYVDATQPPWDKNYRMYSYVTKELRNLVETRFSCVDGQRAGICGHSMGGHGALVIFLRNPHLFKAISLFAPLCRATKTSFGRKCLNAYLGSDESRWVEYDATELVKRQPQKNVEIMIDLGDQDEYLEHLMCHDFVEACHSVGQSVDFRLQEGYDHKYLFIASFVEDHIRRFAVLLSE